MIRVPDGTLRILIQGLKRVRLDGRLHDDPYLVGEFAEVPDEITDSPELEALTRNVQNLFGRVIGSVPYLPDELELAAANVDDPAALSHLVASTMRIKTDEKQRLHSRQQVPNAADELFDLQLCSWSSHACCRAAVYGVGSKIERFRVIRPLVTLKHSHTKPELTGSV